MITTPKPQYNEGDQRFPQGAGQVLELPRLLITLGDVAGIGPEVLLKLWSQPLLFTQARPVVVGDINWLKRSALKFGYTGAIEPVTSLVNWPISNPALMTCIQGTSVSLNSVALGKP